MNRSINSLMTIVDENDDSNKNKEPTVVESYLEEKRLENLNRQQRRAAAKAYNKELSKVASDSGITWDELTRHAGELLYESMKLRDNVVSDSEEIREKLKSNPEIIDGNVKRLVERYSDIVTKEAESLANVADSINSIFETSKYNANKGRPIARIGTGKRSGRNNVDIEAMGVEYLSQTLAMVNNATRVDEIFRNINDAKKELYEVLFPDTENHEDAKSKEE